MCIEKCYVYAGTVTAQGLLLLNSRSMFSTSYRLLTSTLNECTNTFTPYLFPH